MWMNHFKGKQFPKDVMIVAVAYYLRYNLSYREVQEMLFMTEELMYAIQRFIVWYKNTAKCSIIYGRRKIDSPLFVENGRNLYQNQRTLALSLSGD